MVRSHAARLYRTLVQSGPLHEHSTRSATARYKTAQEFQAAKAVDFAVTFCFEAGIPPDAKPPWLWQEAEIRILDSEIFEQGGSLPLSKNSLAARMNELSLGPDPFRKGILGRSLKRKNAVKFAEIYSDPVFTVGPIVNENDAKTSIKNLCFTMRNVPVDIVYIQRYLGRLDHGNRHRIGIYFEYQDQTPCNRYATSLATLFSERSIGRAPLIAAAGSLPLSREERLGLALTVASSVLQLYDTPWLCEYWNENDIFVDMEHKSRIFERAFILRSFPPTAAERPEQSHSYPCRNMTLYSLGIVLIEISLGQPLESMRIEDDPLNTNGEPDMLTDWNIARRVLEKGTVSRESGTRYQDVIYRCMWCEFGSLKTSLDNDDFRRAV